MDINKIRVNLEEAIDVIRTYKTLQTLEWENIQFYSNGVPVDITDLHHTSTPPFGISVTTYLNSGDFSITPTTNQESEEDE